jgi:hypothetical protein
MVAVKTQRQPEAASKKAGLIPVVSEALQSRVKETATVVVVARGVSDS